SAGVLRLEPSLAAQVQDVYGARRMSKKPSLFEINLQLVCNEGAMRQSGSQYYVDAYIRPQVDTLLEQMTDEMQAVCDEAADDLTEIVERYETELEQLLQPARR